MGILNVLLFSFFSWKKNVQRKAFFSVQSNIKTKEAEYFQRDMEAIKTLKYCTSFCLVYNKTRKCRAIERGRCLRTQTHEIFNTSIVLQLVPLGFKPHKKKPKSVIFKIANQDKNDLNINCNGSYTFTVESNDWNTTRNYLHIQFHMQRSLILLNRFRQKYYITWMGKTTCSSQVKKINTIKFHGHMYGVFMTGIILWDIVYSYTT